MRSKAFTLFALFALCSRVFSTPETVPRRLEKRKLDIHEPPKNTVPPWDQVVKPTNNDKVFPHEEEFPEILIEKTMSLLSDGLNSLSRSKDMKIKQFIEMFVFKIGQVTLELEKANKMMEQVSSGKPDLEKMQPSQHVSTRDSSVENKNVKNSPIMPSSSIREDSGKPMHKPVDAKSEMISHFEAEDELVRQLHAQRDENRMAKKNPQIQVVVHHHLPHNVKVITDSSEIVNPFTPTSPKQKEGKILMKLLQGSMDKHAGMQKVETPEKSISKNNIADFTNSGWQMMHKEELDDTANAFEIEDVPTNAGEQRRSNDQDKDLNVFLFSTVVPELQPYTDYFMPSTTEEPPSQQLGNLVHQEITTPSPEQKNPNYFTYPPKASQHYAHETSTKYSQMKNKVPTALSTKNQPSHVYNELSMSKMKTNFLDSYSTDLPIQDRNGYISYSKLPANMKANKHYWDPRHHANERAKKFSTNREAFNNTYPQDLPEAAMHGPYRNIKTSIFRSQYPHHRPHGKTILKGNTHASNSGLQSLKQEQGKPKKAMDSGIPPPANMHKEYQFPSHILSDSPMQDDLERQLRAGKVVILSDSVVRSNFEKHPMKPFKALKVISNDTSHEEVDPIQESD